MMVFEEFVWEWILSELWHEHVNESEWKEGFESGCKNVKLFATTVGSFLEGQGKEQKRSVICRSGLLIGASFLRSTNHFPRRSFWLEQKSTVCRSCNHILTRKGNLSLAILFPPRWSSIFASNMHQNLFYYTFDIKPSCVSQWTTEFVQ